MLELQKLQKICGSLDITQPVTVGYSGGVDSHVLLHALCQLRQEGFLLGLQAVHVNHHLNPQADQWVVHCRNVCDRLNVPLTVLDIYIQNTPGHSLEALARDARYGAISQALPGGSYFFTAHHQDDQAETVLLQLLRGAGPKGLSAMPVEKDFNNIKIFRPLLNVTRDDILEYASLHQLAWIEDPSNQHTDFQRNYLRKNILPCLKQVWPSSTETITRSAAHCAEAEILIKELAVQDFQKCVVNKTQLSISSLQQLSLSRIKQVIRHWLNQQNFRLPPTTKLHQIMTEVLPARADAEPLVSWDAVEVRRYRDQLYAMSPLKSFDSAQCIAWDLSQDLKLPDDLGVLTVEHLIKQGFDPAAIQGNLEIRFRQGGETCRVANREGTHDLKKLFQEWGIPPWQRDRTPLIYYQGHLVWVYTLEIPRSK